jgi:hypothetical protein
VKRVDGKEEKRNNGMGEEEKTERKEEEKTQMNANTPIARADAGFTNHP